MQNGVNMTAGSQNLHLCTEDPQGTDTAKQDMPMTGGAMILTSLPGPTDTMADILTGV